MSEESEEFWGEEKLKRSLPYGIKSTPVYYVCVHCGYQDTLEKLVTLPSLMCPNCGQRIFTKVRAPPTTGLMRKVKAV